MKILVIGHTYVPKINRDKLYELNKKAEVTLVTPFSWKDDLFTVTAEQDNQLKHYRKHILLSGHEKAYFYYPDLAQVIAEVKPDVIHVEQGANAVSYAQAIIYKKLFAKNAKMSFFTWMNLPYANPFPFNAVEHYNLASTDLAICGNQDAKQILLSKKYAGKIEVMPQLGVDEKLFSPYTKKFTKLRGEFTIGYFGRLVEEKGIIDLLLAFSQLKNKRANLLIIGKGPLEPQITKLIDDKNLKSQVKILPSVPHLGIIKHLQRIDALVLPSRTTSFWKEQFGHILIEAMSCGVPVIGSNSGEIPNVISEAGLIFPEGDISALAKNIQLLESDKKLRTKFATKGRQRVLSNYTHKVIADKVLNAFRIISE